MPVQPRASESTVFVRRAMVLVGIAVLFVALHLGRPASTVTPVAIASLIAVVMAALQIAWPRDSDPFSPVSYTSLYLIYAYFGIFASMIVNGEDALPRLPLGVDDRVRIALESVYLNVVFFAIYAGAFAFRMQAHTRDAVEALPRFRWSSPRLTALSIFCAILFVISYAEFQRRLGYVWLSLDELKAGKAVWRNDPSLTWMIRGVQIGFIPLILTGAVAFKSRSPARIALVLAAAVVVALLISTTGQRGIAIYPLVALLGIFHYTYRPIPWKFIFVALLAMVVYVNATTRIRTGQNASFTEAVSDTSGWPLQAFSDHESERSRLDSTAIIMFFFPERLDYLLGDSWKALVAALVPRWVWPEKSQAFPNSDGNLLFRLVGLPAPTPLPALAYANFGWFGIPIWACIMGVLHAGLYAWLRRSPNDLGRPILYLVTLVFFAPTPLGVGSALQFVVPTYLALKLLEKKVVPSRPSVARAVGA